MRTLQALLATLVTVGLFACATSGPADGAPRRDANRISPDEIRTAQTQNAYEMIRSLRPNWLTTRGQHSLSNPTAGQVVVYLDGARAGGVEALRQLQALDVDSVQYMNAAAAGSRFGLDHTGGAILITTRRR